MTVHAQQVEVRRPVVSVSRNLMLAIGFLALIALLVVGVLVLLDAIPVTVDANILQLEKLQELRTTVAGGGFI
jgi:hypothetical protein